MYVVLRGKSDGELCSGGARQKWFPWWRCGTSERGGRAAKKAGCAAGTQEIIGPGNPDNLNGDPRTGVSFPVALSS